MITELMIILIVVGAIIVFIAWTSARRKKRDEEDRREAEESTEKFKQDLEKTANEIIGRMENQAARLEKLLDDSERSRTQLEGRIAELKKIIKKCESQSTEIKDLLARLDDATADVNAMQRQLNLIEQRFTAVMSMQIPVQKPLPQVNAAKTPISPPPILRTPQPDNFAQILEQSMTETNSPGKAESVAIRQRMAENSTEENLPPKRSEQLTKTPPPKKISELPAREISTEDLGDSSIIREMLLAGMTAEEIAKETGLGRGAILLVQQMMRHQLERR